MNEKLKYILLAVVLFCGCSEDSDNGPKFDWPECDHVQTGLTLAEMAEEYDRVARENHIADDDTFRNLYLTEDLQQVEYWYQHPNVILWSGIYLASQALRFRVTGDQEAQDNARRVVAGLRDLTRVTGVEGLYGRTMTKPGVSYDYDGSGNPEYWPDSTAAGYEGWRYHNDVSQDGYAGLMFGYGVALEHLKDKQLLADVGQLAEEVGRHIVGNGLQIIDADGEVTEHGRLYHSALDNFPGFNAMLASSFVKVAQRGSDDPDLDDFYYACMMDMRRGVNCPDIESPDVTLGSYIESMEEMLFLFMPNKCGMNYDNFDMCYQAMYPLARHEQDLDLHQRLIGVLRSGMYYNDDPDFRSMDVIGNAMFTFIYAALTGDGPDDDPRLADAVDDAICTLKNFPPVKFDRYIPTGTQEVVCRTRLDRPSAAERIPLSEYHFDNYLWRLDPYEIQEVERPENRRMVFSPEDFLIAYWLGRYHGLIGPEL
jgi:hypothetical protein